MEKKKEGLIMHEVTLKMKSITKSFSSVQVLKGADLEARSGEVLALLGTNGAGVSFRQTHIKR